MRFLTILLIACMVTIQAPLFAEAEASPPQDITGLEWLNLTIGDRQQYVFIAMKVLDKNGVPLSNTVLDYYNEIERAIKLKPENYSRSITSILASVVYDSEPGSRAALDKRRQS